MNAADEAATQRSADHRSATHRSADHRSAHHRAGDDRAGADRSGGVRSGPLARLARRWPTAAGIAVAVASGYDITGGAEIAPVVIASAFLYLGAAALRRPGAAWPLFLVSFVLIGLGKVLPGFDPAWWMLGAAALLAGYGLARGGLRPAWGLPLQAAAMLAFGAVALLAAGSSPVWAGVLVAGGLLAHAAWDVHHHRTDRVVVRSMAEFCAVLDVLLAVIVLVVTLL